MIGEGVKSPQKGGTGTDIRGLFPRMKARWAKVFAYGFMVTFVGCTVFLAFNPAGNGSPLSNSLFTSSSFSATIAPYRSRFNNLISHYFPNSTSSTIIESSSVGREIGSQEGGVLPILAPANDSSVHVMQAKGPASKNQTEGSPTSKKDGSFEKIPSNAETSSLKNESGALLPTPEGSIAKQDGGLIAKNKTAHISSKNLTGSGLAIEKGVSKTNRTESEISSNKSGLAANIQKGSTTISQGDGVRAKNATTTSTRTQSINQSTPSSSAQSKNQATAVSSAQTKNQTTAFTENPKTVRNKEIPASPRLSASLKKGNASASQNSNSYAKEMDVWIQGMVGCDIFHGQWVQDDSYPLYSEGSCPHIDEPFDCFHNGRLDRAYQKLRWQPNGCKIPRFNAIDLLERLRGKRLVFVGDSLNRNMWESLVCALRNSVRNKTDVFEASGQHEFKTEGSYSFLFKDYNCTIEFFRSPFLVQEWEMPDSSGKKKETLRLDVIERSSFRYKDANIIVFNTGHWWTHEKTSKGRDYYQEGNRVYSELNVAEAFHKALHTWAMWVDANVNPNKTFIFFRGYSSSHFSGGQWNSGGACDKETEPIKNEKFLSPYPPKMRVLETVLKDMKTPVSYLNITRMTDFRKDAHPSMYRKRNLTDEERREPERFQDCSHWCLPGVPDAWNELLYAQILVKQSQTPNW